MKLMKHITSLCLCIVSILTSGIVSGQDAAYTDQVILKLKAPSGRSLEGSKIQAINTDFGATKVYKQQLAKESDEYIYVIRFRQGADITQIIEAYYKTGEAEYAEPDQKGSGGGVIPNDPHFSRQWGCHNNETFPDSKLGADIDMENAWEIEKGDSTIIVTIIDSGTKLDHPEFAGRIWKNTAEIPGNAKDDDQNGYVDDVTGWDFANNDNNPTDDHGHGTNVSGIIGANANNSIGYAGIDWNCRLMILKGLDQNNFGYFSWWASAIYYAVGKGAKVINMSLGGTSMSITLQNAVNYALNHNVVIVACMMNTNSGTVYYPAGLPGVIAVGSTDPDDKRSSPFFWSPTSGSNYGSHISVVAPGNIIYGLHYQSNTNYDSYWGGTSQAAPVVSGIASLLLAQDPTRNPSMIKYLIETSAEDQVGNPDEDIPGRDNYYGYGRVNAFKALSLCRPLVQPAAITGPVNVCAAQSSVVYTVPDVSYATSYVWSLPVGVTGVSALNSITVNFSAAAASGTISVRGANPCGNGPASSTHINVQPLPDPTGTISGSNDVCQGQKNVSYHVPQIPSASSYVWFFPNGTTGITSVNTITYNYDSLAVSGTLVVKGKNNCGTGTPSSMAVTVNPLPPAAGAISGIIYLCPSQQGTTYTVPQITNATSYEWTLPAGATGTSNTNSITVNFDPSMSSGNITVKGKNACGSGAVSTLPVQMNALPATADDISGTTHVCQGQPGITYTVPEIANATSYEWTLPSGAVGVSSSNSILINYDPQAISGQISVKGKNACGTGNSSALHIIVDPLPAAAGAISGNTTVCAGQKKVSYTVPLIAHADSYEWVLPEGLTGTSDTNSIVVDYGLTAVSGEIKVKGKNACGSGPAYDLTINVTPKPATPEVTFSNKLLRSDAPSGNQWYNKFGPILGANSQEYAATHNGTHYTIVTLGGCSSDTSNKVEVVHTGISNIQQGQVGRLYPNPVQNELTIEKERPGEANIEISNGIGQVIYRNSFSDLITIPAGNLVPGIYSIKLEGEKAVQHLRFVKE